MIQQGLEVKCQQLAHLILHYKSLAPVLVHFSNVFTEVVDGNTLHAL